MNDDLETNWCLATLLNIKWHIICHTRCNGNPINRCQWIVCLLPLIWHLVCPACLNLEDIRAMVLNGWILKWMRLAININKTLAMMGHNALVQSSSTRIATLHGLGLMGTMLGFVKPSPNRFIVYSSQYNLTRHSGSWCLIKYDPQVVPIIFMFNVINPRELIKFIMHSCWGLVKNLTQRLEHIRLASNIY